MLADPGQWTHDPGRRWERNQVARQAQGYLQDKFPGVKLDDSGKTGSAVPRQALIRHLVIDFGLSSDSVSRILNMHTLTIRAALKKEPDFFEQQVLKWKKREQQELQRTKRDLFVKKAIEVVAAHYLLDSSDDMFSRTRTKRLNHPRQTLMYILFKETDLNLKEIARILGRSDHTITLNAIARVEKALEDDEDLGERIKALVGEIKSQVESSLK